MIEMPYKGDTTSMVIIAPQEHKGLAALEKQMTTANLKTGLGALKKRETDVRLPKDFMLGRSVDAPGTPKVSGGMDIEDGWMGLDIGPQTIEEYSNVLRRMKTVFWNGPMGLFEQPPFDQGTMQLAQALSELGSNRVVGGGGGD